MAPSSEKRYLALLEENGSGRQWGRFKSLSEVWTRVCREIHPGQSIRVVKPREGSAPKLVAHYFCDARGTLFKAKRARLRQEKTLREFYTQQLVYFRLILEFRELAKRGVPLTPRVLTAWREAIQKFVEHYDRYVAVLAERTKQLRGKTMEAEIRAMEEDFQRRRLEQLRQERKEVLEGWNPGAVTLTDAEVRRLFAMVLEVLESQEKRLQELIEQAREMCLE